MSYTRVKGYNFGLAYAGVLTNAGYALEGDTSWKAANEVLAPGGLATGGVKATVTFPGGYAGILLWCPDTTATPKRYTFVEVNPGDDEYTDGKVSAVPAGVLAAVVVNTTSVNEVLRAVGSAVAGNLSESADHSQSFLSDINDPGTIRITAALSSTARGVTLNRS